MMPILLWATIIGMILVIGGICAMFRIDDWLLEFLGEPVPGQPLDDAPGKHTR